MLVLRWRRRPGQHGVGETSGVGHDVADHHRAHVRLPQEGRGCTARWEVGNVSGVMEMVPRRERTRADVVVAAVAGADDDCRRCSASRPGPPARETRRVGEDGGDRYAGEDDGEGSGSQSRTDTDLACQWCIPGSSGQVR